jgi:hypothetical protein
MRTHREGRPKRNRIRTKVGRGARQTKVPESDYNRMSLLCKPIMHTQQCAYIPTIAYGPGGVPGPSINRDTAPNS